MDKYKRKFLSQPMAYIATQSRKGSRSLSASWLLRALEANVLNLRGLKIVNFDDFLEICQILMIWGGVEIHQILTIWGV